VDETNNPQFKGFYEVFDGHHPGVDFNLPEGTPIKAALPGIVVRKELHQGMGNTLAIRTGSVYVLYAHLSQIGVELGQLIRAKQLVAYSGNTGSATNGPHLHFEFRDLAKVGLKESVFEPVFGTEVGRYQSTFNYVINNANTVKTFVSLSLRYFGVVTYASFIRDINPVFASYSFDAPLPHGQSLIIPSPKLEKVSRKL
jgi:murein DD-endopeptidase MepM/ murein hydrolase activator NlpD